MLVFGTGYDAPAERLAIDQQGGQTLAPHLRVFHEADVYESNIPPAAVRIRLGDLIPLLESAHGDRCAWLSDFLDDEVRITDDLYEILQEYSGFRPSA